MISVDIVDVIVESDTGRGLEPITLAQHSPASVLSSFRAGYRTLLAGFPTVKRPIVAQPAALAMGHPARVLRSWAQHLQPQQAAGNTSDGFAVQNRAAPVPGVGNPQNTAPLRFHPCTNNAPAALTVPQIAEYNSAGFLSGIPLLSSGETAELRGYFEAALASIGAQQAVPEGGEESPQRLEDGSIVHYAPQYTIASVHLSSARVWDLMRHPLLVALVTDILGPNVVGWGAHLFAKLPHDPMRVSFHQDAVYWPIHPSKGVEVWLALDDVDSGNSCMRFVSGSHQLGALSFETSTEEEKNVLNLTVRGTTWQASFSVPVPVSVSI